MLIVHDQPLIYEQKLQWKHGITPLHAIRDRRFRRPVPVPPSDIAAAESEVLRALSGAGASQQVRTFITVAWLRMLLLITRRACAALSTVFVCLIVCLYMFGGFGCVLFLTSRRL